MEQRFEGNPRADIRVEGRRLARSEVAHDWGSRLQWEIRRNGQVIHAITDDGAGVDDEPTGTGLSIVGALVRDELRGTLELHSNGGLRVEVAFPA